MSFIDTILLYGMFHRSPMPYTGSKFKLLPQILPHVPTHSTFYDLFCGSFNVGFNSGSQKIVAVDSMGKLIEIFNYWKANPDTSFQEIEDLVAKYSLDKTNAEGYYALRDDYNQNPTPIKLFTLVAHSFNFQIRFNSKNEFNMPFGKNRSMFNKGIRSNLNYFLNWLKDKQVGFVCGDFSDQKPQAGDFVYADPPYLLSEATYNASWTAADDTRVWDFLGKLECDWAMSNVVQHKGLKHNALIAWAESGSFPVFAVNCHYRKNSYHKLDRNSFTQEVLITSHDLGQKILSAGTLQAWVSGL